MEDIKLIKSFQSYIVHFVIDHTHTIDNVQCTMYNDGTNSYEIKKIYTYEKGTKCNQELFTYEKGTKCNWELFTYEKMSTTEKNKKHN